MGPKYYFIDDAGKRIGPLNYDDMVDCIQSGQLQTHHQTWKKGNEDWNRLETFPEFTDPLASQPPPFHSTSIDILDYLWYSKKKISGPDYGLRMVFLDAIAIWFIWDLVFTKIMTWNNQAPLSLQAITNGDRIAETTLVLAFLIARILDTALTLRRIQPFGLSQAWTWTFSISSGVFRWVGVWFLVAFMGNFIAVDDMATARSVVLLTMFWMPIMCLAPTLSLILKEPTKDIERQRKQQRWMKATLSSPLIVLVASLIIKTHFEYILIGGWIVLIAAYWWYQHEDASPIYPTKETAHSMNVFGDFDLASIPPVGSHESAGEQAKSPPQKKKSEAKYSVSEQVILWIALAPAILLFGIPFLLIMLELVLSIFGIDGPFPG